ncbi:MAG: cytochrome c1 [Gemmatimonadaceae bacterium]|nr:cytochrome c1 [Acetobacteraceae bacterium]
MNATARLLLAAGAMLAAGVVPASAAGPAAELPKQPWSFNGPFGTFDRASAQRGFQVYKEVCSSCHGMTRLYYRNLTALGLSEDQVKAIAASVTVPGEINDEGVAVERAGLPSDHIRSPYANDKAARAANGGALPPDQSLIVKAREGGADYIYGLLTGYRDPPAGVTVGDGLHYNLYMAGNQLAMAAPLTQGSVTYADGTPASVEQMSRDVSQFLMWASHPEMEERKRMGIKVVLFLTLLTGLTYALKKKIWKDVH